MKLKTQRPGFLTGLLVGALITAPVIALFFVGAALVGLPLLPLDVIDWAARSLPGQIITVSIETMVTIIRGLNLGPTDQVAKLGEQIIGTITLFMVGVVASGVLFVVLRRFDDERAPLVGGFITGLAVGIPMAILSAGINAQLQVTQTPPAINALWIVMVFIAWGLALGWIYRDLTSLPRTSSSEAELQQLNRRQFLIRLGGATATLTVVGAGLSLLANREDSNAIPEVAALNPTAQPTSRPTARPTEAAEETQATAEAGETAEPTADSTTVEPAPGTRPEYTPVKDHYRIDISSRPPVIDGTTWTLPITGLVANELTLTLDDFYNKYESQDVTLTMACISNEVGGDLISTTRWTGVSLQKILADIQPLPEGKFLRMTSADGFDEVLEISFAVRDSSIMLAYLWDGQPLTAEHGFPLRIHIPNRYGMKQPKWMTGMEVIADWEPGYWVRRTWDSEAIVRTTSVVDTIAVDAIYERDGQRYVPIGGIAYASARGISKVEVMVGDSGEWVEAQLRQPFSDRTWVIWRYDWPFEAGMHTFRVRAYDGNGELQITEPARTHPSGATGIHSRSARL